MTPCYGGVCNISYVKCLMDTIELLKSLNIDVTMEFCGNDSLVTRARNNLIGKAMNDLSVTHFIFIDSDIVWNPLDILKLMNSNKDIIGGIYPMKNYQWSNINNELLSSIVKSDENEIILKKEFSNEDLLRCKIVKYNLNYLDNVIKIENKMSKPGYLEKRSQVEMKICKRLYCNPMCKGTSKHTNNFSNSLDNKLIIKLKKDGAVSGCV
jgi:hypothetical protein